MSQPEQLRDAISELQAAQLLVLLTTFSGSPHELHDATRYFASAPASIRTYSHESPPLLILLKASTIL